MDGHWKLQLLTVIISDNILHYSVTNLVLTYAYNQKTVVIIKQSAALTITLEYNKMLV